jgi:hypothetical protein
LGEFRAFVQQHTISARPLRARALTRLGLRRTEGSLVYRDLSLGGIEQRQHNMAGARYRGKERETDFIRWIVRRFAVVLHRCKDWDTGQLSRPKVSLAIGVRKSDGYSRRCQGGNHMTSRSWRDCGISPAVSGIFCCKGSRLCRRDRNCSRADLPRTFGTRGHATMRTARTVQEVRGRHANRFSTASSPQ